MREGAEPPRVGYASDDGRLVVSVGGFLQARVTAEQDAESIVSLPRTRFYTFGHVLDPAMRYRVMLGTVGMDPHLRVFDAYGEWSASEALRIRAGHFKVPALREWMESARLLGSVERSSATVAVLPGRGTGAMLSGDPSDHLSYAVGAFDGPEAFSEPGPTAAGRVVWNVLGEAIEGEIDFEHTAPRMSFGASMLGRKLEMEERLHDEEILYGADVAVRARGVDIGAEAFQRRRFGGAGEATDAGGYVRGDYYFRVIRSSIGARISVLDLESEATPRRFVDYELDVGWYPYGHQLKLLTDVGIRSNLVDATLQPTFRAQLQAAF